MYVVLPILRSYEADEVLGSINSINLDVHQGIEIVASHSYHSGNDFLQHLCLKVCPLAVDILLHNEGQEHSVLHKAVEKVHSRVKPLKEDA